VAHGHERADAQSQRLAVVVNFAHLFTVVDPTDATRLEMVRSPTLAGALAGSVSLALGYAATRRAGLTRVDLAARVLPGHPRAGRAGQLVAGTAACLPAAALATPARGLLAGAAAGVVAAAATQRPRDRLLAVALHALAGGVAAGVSRAARERRRGG
jgi:hypothetical protein